MTPKNQKSRLSWALLIVSAVLIQYSCDVLEEDVKPAADKVITETPKFYSLPNAPTFINLNSLIKTQGQVQLRIISQPRKGNLSELSKGIVQYSPNKSFTKGNDAFRFSVLSTDDKLLMQDSVVIIVGSDISKLPCGFYTQSDSVVAPVTGSVIIDVLRNDILCDSVNIKLEVYKPAPNAVPLFGTAIVVSGNKIQYTPGPTFHGVDYIFYKVTSTMDSSRHSYGKVSISGSGLNTGEQFTLGNDYYRFRIDSLASDTLRLSVFQNDVLVNGIGFQSSIIATPRYGTATVNGLQFIKYVAAKPIATRTDSLTYRVCRGTDCKTARTYITFY
jgi:hypothetical protein